MKNVNYFKKFAVMVLAAMMTLSTFAMPTFGATSTTLKVQGVDADATVKAYQVVTKDANNNWVMVSDYGEKGTGDDADKYFVKGTPFEYNFKQPSADALAALAKIAKDKNPTFTFEDYVNDEWVKSGQANVGSYLVLAEATKDVNTIYNPMLVSINPEGSGVNDDDKNNVIEATVANAKKSNIPFEKVVERDKNFGRVNGGANAENKSVDGDEASVDGDALTTTGENGLDGNRGDTAALNNVVTYRINTMIPKYADNYFVAESNGTYKEKTTVNGKDFYNPKFKVHDTLSDGLELVANSVKVYKLGEDTELAKEVKGVKMYDVVTSGIDETFQVVFTPAGIKEYGKTDIEVRYQAKVVAAHGVNFDGEKNDAYPSYTRKPGQDGDGEECEGPHKKTYHYTFTINGKINGNNSSENREVIKVGLDKYNHFVYQETVTKNETGWKPLQGVVFKLYKAKVNGNDWEADGDAVRTATSDANGILRGMDQIDAGKYVLIEEDLGNNKEYAKNTTPIKLEITADLDTLGRLTHYKVEVDGITVGDYTKEYSGEEEGLAANGTIVSNVMNAGGVVDRSKVAHSVTYNGTTLDDTDAEAADIINTKVGTLPSTGGMGTVLFTVGGIAIMALALFLLFGGKKKEQQK